MELLRFVSEQDYANGEEDFAGRDDDERELDLERDAEELPDESGAETVETGEDGLIRHVPGAHLVYKRADEFGTYTELWAYNVDPNGKGARQAQDLRNAILSGTDIPRGSMKSADGQQVAKVFSRGNAELLHITGLVN